MYARTGLRTDPRKGGYASGHILQMNRTLSMHCTTYDKGFVVMLRDSDAPQRGHIGDCQGRNRTTSADSFIHKAHLPWMVASWGRLVPHS